MAEVVYSSLSSIDVHKSASIVLKCHINGNGIEEWRWMKNDKPISSSSIGGALVIRHPSETDTGYYKCAARNKIGTIFSQPYRVEIQANPHNSYHNGILCESKVIGDRPIGSHLVCRYKRSGRLHRKRSALENGSQQLSPKRKKINVAEDNAATLNCDLNRLDRKSNQLSVKWKKDGKEFRQLILNEQANDMAHTNLMESSMFRDDGRIIVNPKNGSITINSTIPSDAGVYEVCTLNCLIFSFFIFLLLFYFCFSFFLE